LKIINMTSTPLHKQRFAILTNWQFRLEHTEETVQDRGRLEVRQHHMKMLWPVCLRASISELGTVRSSARTDFMPDRCGRYCVATLSGWSL